MIVTLQTHGESEEMVQSGNSGGAAEAGEEIPWALHKVSTFSNLILRESGVSIIFKIRVFYKARFEGFEFL